MKTTKGNVKSAFEFLCSTMGKRIATSFNDIGAWRLDYYQGYNIEEISNEGGGITHPLGSQRMKAEAFYDAAWFTIRAIELRERDQQQAKTA